MSKLTEIEDELFTKFLCKKTVRETLLALIGVPITKDALGMLSEEDSLILKKLDDVL